jgi:hypothetical protein
MGSGTWSSGGPMTDFACPTSIWNGFRRGWFLRRTFNDDHLPFHNSWSCPWLWLRRQGVLTMGELKGHGENFRGLALTCKLAMRSLRAVSRRVNGERHRGVIRWKTDAISFMWEPEVLSCQRVRRCPQEGALGRCGRVKSPFTPIPSRQAA